MIALEITDLLKGLDDDVIAFRLVALYHALLLFFVSPPCKEILILKIKTLLLLESDSCKNIDFEGGTGIGELE